MSGAGYGIVAQVRKIRAIYDEAQVMKKQGRLRKRCTNFEEGAQIIKKEQSSYERGPQIAIEWQNL